MDSSEFTISTYGVRMPRIIYGTAWKKERTSALVEQAVSLGFRGVDTACQPKHYDESGVGDGLLRCVGSGLDRGDVYLQSKFTPSAGQDPQRMPYDPEASLADQVTQSFAMSLRNLKTSYLDCLVLHSPLQNPQQLMEVWQAMEAIFHAEGVRQLGISNCYELEQFEYLCRKARVKPAVLQNRFFADKGYDKALRAFCRENGVQYQSFWTLTANPQVLAHQTLQSLAAKHARTPAQVFLRYLTQNAVIPLTGTSSETHMREDLAIFDFELSDDDLDSVTSLL